MGGIDPTTPDRTSLDPASLDDLVQSCAVEHHCPTVSWGVVRDGALTLTGSVGDVSEHTVYRIASMTKVFSAAATLALRDEGSIRLDDTSCNTPRNWRHSGRRPTMQHRSQSAIS